MDSTIGDRLSTDQWFAYNVLSLVIPFLDIADVLRCSNVCRLWRDIVKDPEHWRSVTIRNCRVNFYRMATVLGDLKTVHLKLVDCKFVPLGRNMFLGLKNLQDLRTIELSECSSKLIENMPEEIPDIKVVKAYIVCGTACLKLDISCISRLDNLCELKLYCNRDLENIDKIFLNLKNLQHLYLLGIKNLDFQVFSNLKLNKNSRLDSLGLGDCCKLPNEFLHFLNHLTSLKKLRLETCVDWDPFSILEGLSQIDTLECLELFDISVVSGFYRGIKLCTNLKELSIVPSPHRFIMIYYISRIFFGTVQLRDTLKKFTWGFSERYMTHFRKLLDVDDTVAILRDITARVHEDTVIRLDHLQIRTRALMPDTEVTITRSINTGNVFT